MKLHEYQAKSLLKKFGVTVQDGHALNDLRYFDDAVNDLMKRGISEFLFSIRRNVSEKMGKVLRS